MAAGWFKEPTSARSPCGSRCLLKKLVQEEEERKLSPAFDIRTCKGSSSVPGGGTKGRPPKSEESASEFRDSRAGASNKSKCWDSGELSKAPALGAKFRVGSGVQFVPEKIEFWEFWKYVFEKYVFGKYIFFRFFGEDGFSGEDGFLVGDHLWKGCCVLSPSPAR